MMEKQLISAGYKQTEVGVIPEDWNVEILSSICEKITDGTHDTPKPTTLGVPFLTAIHVKENRIDFESCYYLPKSIHDEIYKRCNPQKNDVLMVNIGAGVATSALVKVDYEFSLKNVALLKPKKQKIIGAYLNFYQSYVKNKVYESLATGGAQPFLSLFQIGQLKISLPRDIEEQTAIANALSDVDTLIAALEKLINKKSAIKTATMQQLLTGKKRLPPFDQLNTGYKQTELGEIPGDWEVSTLERVSSQPMQNGLFYEPNRKGKGVYLINVGDMYKSAPISVGELELFDANAAEKKTFKVFSGDLFFTRSSIVPSGIAYCNIYESQVLDCELVFDSHLIRLRTNSNIANARYTYLACMATYARKFLIGSAKTATMTTIDQGALKKCPIILPPIEEQTAIANVLSDMDKDLEALQQRLHKTQQIKQGMMQELLTGKTRLIKGEMHD